MPWCMFKDFVHLFELTFQLLSPYQEWSPHLNIFRPLNSCEYQFRGLK